MRVYLHWTVKPKEFLGCGAFVDEDDKYGNRYIVLGGEDDILPYLKHHADDNYYLEYHKENDTWWIGGFSGETIYGDESREE
jgi:hypothetical protein